MEFVMRSFMIPFAGFFFSILFIEITRFFKEEFDNITKDLKQVTSA